MNDFFEMVELLSCQRKSLELIKSLKTEKSNSYWISLTSSTKTLFLLKFVEKV